MSKWRRLWIRIREEDLRRLEVLAASLKSSRDYAVRFSINNNTLSQRNICQCGKTKEET